MTNSQDKALVHVRKTAPEDAVAVSRFLKDLERAGKRNLPSDAEFVLNTYICNELLVGSHVATDENGRPFGIQILLREKSPNPGDDSQIWGGIGTHVAEDAARRGTGRALFAATRQAAQNAGLLHIDATIGETNAEGLAYYGAMGFETYKILGSEG